MAEEVGDEIETAELKTLQEYKIGIELLEEGNYGEAEI